MQGRIFPIKILRRKKQSFIAWYGSNEIAHSGQEACTYSTDKNFLEE